MRKGSPLLATLISLALFLLLEGLSFFIISKESLFQRVKISTMAVAIKDRGGEAISELKYYTQLKEVNRVLEEENIALKNRVERSEERYQKMVRGELMEQIEERELPRGGSYHYIAAKVISNSTNKKQNHLILNRGSRDGVTEEMGVVTSKGVVGVVSKVSNSYCYVVSLLNTSQSVSAKIDSSGVFGLLSWDGLRSDRVILKEIPYHTEFSKGDLVTTSGYSALFPPDIPIGTIISSSSKSGIHHQIEVKLLEQFSKLRDVEIVFNRDKEEIFTLKERGGRKL